MIHINIVDQRFDMLKIHLRKLQQIVKEEINRHVLVEGDREKSAIDHASAATKCLDAIEKYKEVASPKALAEMQKELDKMVQVLNRVVASPLQYADSVPSTPGPDSEGKLKSIDSPQKKKSIKPNISKGQMTKKL